MEIYKIKRNECEVNVIFTGKQYIFHNSYFGILAVATRKGYKDEEMHTFILEYGNENTLGGSFCGSYCETMAKQFINNTESQYVKCKTYYEVVKVDVNRKYYIDILAKER